MLNQDVREKLLNGHINSINVVAFLLMANHWIKIIIIISAVRLNIFVQMSFQFQMCPVNTLKVNLNGILKDLEQVNAYFIRIIIKLLQNGIM